MKNYKFNAQFANQPNVRDKLYLILTGLIEVQRLATIYRDTGKTLPSQHGICNALETITNNWTISFYLNKLFFKSYAYPVQPYYSPTFLSPINYGEFRWGKNPRGNARRKLLSLMIKDLTQHLQHKG